MADTHTIHYDASAPEAAAVRAALRPPLLVLARAKDRGRLDEHDGVLFNLELAGVTHRVQDDPEWAVRSLVELLLALDLSIDWLARGGVSREMRVCQLLSGGDGEGDRGPL